MMLIAKLKKQISIFVDVDVWTMIRSEAARQRIPMTELCCKWMKKDIDKMMKK